MKPYTIIARNVNWAFADGLAWLRVAGVPQQGLRGGRTAIVAPGPVLTVTQHPLERVLWHPQRRANPFFHLMEAIWMLAGSNDLPWVAQFNKGMLAYSDDKGATQPAAYGHRWRNHFDRDQLLWAVNHLSAQPHSRRCVITMWDPVVDMLAASEGGADVPCNTQAYLQVVDGALEMTVTCRSNDMVWGAHGANSFHLSFVQQAVAEALGLRVGAMAQLSNNYHLYTDMQQMTDLLACPLAPDDYDEYLTHGSAARQASPLTLPGPAFAELLGMCEHFVGGLVTENPHPYLRAVAQPVYAAWQAYLEWRELGHAKFDMDRAHTLLVHAYRHTNDAILAACRQWLTQTEENFNATNKL